MNNKLWASVIVGAFLISGCAVRQLIKKGDQFLQAGNFAEAVASYDEALRLSPGNAIAHKRIREARREAVRNQLDLVERALVAKELKNALSHITTARAMPLDLEDVDLVRRLDGTMDRAAIMAQERVLEFCQRGHFVSAVALAAQVVEASPGVVARKKWADQVRQQAISHYTALTKDLADLALYGSATIQLAMAHQVGEEVPVTEVERLWNKFAEPTCFAKPTIEVVDLSGQAQDLAKTIQPVAHSALLALRERCGEGSRELGIKIELNAVELKDDSQTVRQAKALPGENIQTEEVYFEEEPYTEIEVVTEYESRREKVEKRDCAPRPGKDRGCVTWTEEVTVQVPNKVKREVTKVRRIKKRRPVAGPLPADKVVSFDVTTVNRKVAYTGAIKLMGAASTQRNFVIERVAIDSGNAEAKGPGLVIPQDPLEAKSMADLTAEAALAVASEVQKTVAAAVDEWVSSYEAEAQKNILGGQLPQAEEKYLKLLALGVEPTPALAKFFSDRYGRPISRVMEILAAGLGRKSNQSVANAAQKTKVGLFPTRQVGTFAQPKEDVGMPSPLGPSPAPLKSVAPGVSKTAPTGKPKISADELRALENESLDALKGNSASPGTATDGSAGEVLPKPAAVPNPQLAPAEPKAPKNRQPIPIVPAK